MTPKNFIKKPDEYSSGTKNTPKKTFPQNGSPFCSTKVLEGV